MQIQLKNVRMSFANIRKPYVPKTGDPKFTFNGIVGPDTRIVVSKADGSKKTLTPEQVPTLIDALCKEKFGKPVPAAKLTNYAYAKADEQVGSRGPRIDENGDYYDGYDEDTMYFSAGTKVEDAPDGILIIDQKREPLPATAGHPVNGDYVNAIINMFAYEYEGKKGISASLEGVQMLKKGEPFGASKIESNAFDEEELEDDEVEADEADADVDAEDLL